PFAVKGAAHITSVSEGTNDGILRRYKKLKRSDFTALPFGGEPEVFDYLNKKPSAGILGISNGTFKLVYTGAMWEAAYPVLDCFLDALKLMKERNPDLFAKIKVHFIGTTYRPDASGHFQVLPRADAKSVSEVISETPERLPFLDALRSLLQADGLLILGSVEPHYTASRLLPYIHSKRPLFALFHKESDGSKLLEQSSAGTLLKYSAESLNLIVEDVYSTLVRFIERKGLNERNINLDLIEQNSAKSLTAKLALVFDRVAQQERVAEL